MKFNLKYLILPLSIFVCINNYNINAMNNKDENPNKIIENNNKNKLEINNQVNNDLLKVNINNEEDSKLIKQLITQSIENIPSV